MSSQGVQLLSERFIRFVFDVRNEEDYFCCQRPPPISIQDCGYYECSVWSFSLIGKLMSLICIQDV